MPINTCILGSWFHIGDNHSGRTIVTLKSIAAISDNNPFNIPIHSHVFHHIDWKLLLQITKRTNTYMPYLSHFPTLVIPFIFILLAKKLLLHIAKHQFSTGYTGYLAIRTKLFNNPMHCLIKNTGFVKLIKLPNTFLKLWYKYSKEYYQWIYTGNSKFLLWLKLNSNLIKLFWEISENLKAHQL